VGIQRFIDKMRAFEDSLVFEKYLVASPAILKEIIMAMSLRHGERSEGKPSIKTALVIGGPGSGKDSMAKLVRLFSPGYRLGPLVVLNMASFRPKSATARTEYLASLFISWGWNFIIELQCGDMVVGIIARSGVG
jgi:hypothetical protein